MWTPSSVARTEVKFLMAGRRPPRLINIPDGDEGVISGVLPLDDGLVALLVQSYLISTRDGLKAGRLNKDSAAGKMKEMLRGSLFKAWNRAPGEISDRALYDQSLTLGTEYRIIS
jgi:hypothetical protein